MRPDGFASGAMGLVSRPRSEWMGWMIGRAAVLSDPEGAKRKALEKL
jgi:hypothetical protein